MIRVAPAQEYAGFNAEVRIPGAAFLTRCPSPNSEQFRKNNFWSKAARELHSAYSGICAYTAMYLPEQSSVDHYLPKTMYPKLAYEWANFRLASMRVNNTKGNCVDILDPFEIQDDWFYMDIPTCLLSSNPDLPRNVRVKIEGTINSLRLNSDDSYVQERCNILVEYGSGDVTIGFLQRRYPFIAKEIGRQGLTQQDIKARLKI